MIFYLNPRGNFYLVNLPTEGDLDDVLSILRSLLTSKNNNIPTLSLDENDIDRLIRSLQTLN